MASCAVDSAASSWPSSQQDAAEGVVRRAEQRIGLCAVSGALRQATGDRRPLEGFGFHPGPEIQQCGAHGLVEPIARDGAFVPALRLREERRRTGRGLVRRRLRPNRDRSQQADCDWKHSSGCWHDPGITQKSCQVISHATPTPRKAGSSVRMRTRRRAPGANTLLRRLATSVLIVLVTPGLAPADDDVYARCLAMYAELRSYADRGVVISEYGAWEQGPAHVHDAHQPRPAALSIRLQETELVTTATSSGATPRRSMRGGKPRAGSADYPNPNNVSACSQALARRRPAPPVSSRRSGTPGPGFRDHSPTSTSLSPTEWRPSGDTRVTA